MNNWPTDYSYLWLCYLFQAIGHPNGMGSQWKVYRLVKEWKAKNLSRSLLIQLLNVHKTKGKVLTFRNGNLDHSNLTYSQFHLSFKFNLQLLLNMTVLLFYTYLMNLMTTDFGRSRNVFNINGGRNLPQVLMFVLKTNAISFQTCNVPCQFMVTHLQRW